MINQIVFDFSFLRGRIRELYQTEKNFAKALKDNIGMSSGTFSNKINGKTNFSDVEIFVICRLLNIPLEKVNLYFFKLKYEFNSYKPIKCETTHK